MKHSTASDCTVLGCLLAAVVAVASTGCGSAALPEVQYHRNIDCAYHVLDDVLDHNDELIARVISVGEGPLQIEELVDVLAELKKNDVEIIESGKRLRSCIPEELLK